MFVYIHFNVPPTRITDLVRIVSDEKIDMEQSPLSMYLLLSTWFDLFIQLTTPFITFVS